jgi:hypothetical protein
LRAKVRDDPDSKLSKTAQDVMGRGDLVPDEIVVPIVEMLPITVGEDEALDDIIDLHSLKWDFEKPDGKIPWITRFRFHEGKYPSDFVAEGPVGMHYLPAAKRLAVGGGRNRMLAPTRLGYRNAAQLKEAGLGRFPARYLAAGLGGQNQTVGGRLAAGAEAYPWRAVRGGFRVAAPAVQ